VFDQSALKKGITHVAFLTICGLLVTCFWIFALNAEPLRVEPIDVNGYRALLSRSRGKVVLVNVWATWCEPCKLEMKDLLSASRRFKPEEVTVILISTDSPKLRQTTVVRFLESVDARLPSYIHSSTDPQGLIDAIDEQWGGEIPFTAVYDRAGHSVSSFS